MEIVYEIDVSIVVKIYVTIGVVISHSLVVAQNTAL
jgi:hypothetical protein